MKNDSLQGSLIQELEKTVDQDIDSGSSSSLHFTSHTNPGRVKWSQGLHPSTKNQSGHTNNKTQVTPDDIDSGNGPAPQRINTHLPPTQLLTSNTFELEFPNKAPMQNTQLDQVQATPTPTANQAGATLKASQLTASIPTPPVFFHNIAGFSVTAIEKHSRRIDQLWPDISTSARAHFPEFASIYSSIKSRNLPNFLGARITIKSDLNLENWEHSLKDYHDRDVCLFLRYGWPVGYEADVTPTSVDNNHQSAVQHASHVKKFIDVELEHKAVIGPFKGPPFVPWTRVSPILTRPKKDSIDRRITS